MIYLSHYSLQKFMGFCPEEKLLALDKLISALEMSLSSETERIRIINHILELQPLLPDDIPEKLRVFL